MYHHVPIPTLIPRRCRRQLILTAKEPLDAEECRRAAGLTPSETEILKEMPSEHGPLSSPGPGGIFPARGRTRRHVTELCDRLTETAGFLGPRGTRKMAVSFSSILTRTEGRTRVSDITFDIGIGR